MGNDTDETIDTTNDYMLGCSGDDLIPILPIGRMPKDKALRLAAYIVTMADTSPDHEQFHKVLAAVESV